MVELFLTPQIKTKMPKINCLCGENIDMSRIPNPQEFKLISSGLIEKLQEEIINLFNNEEVVSEKINRELILLFHSRFTPTIYECQSCGRIAVLQKASDNIPSLWFVREKILNHNFPTLNSMFGTNDNK